MRRPNLSRRLFDTEGVDRDAPTVEAGGLRPSFWFGACAWACACWLRALFAFTRAAAAFLSAALRSEMSASIWASWIDSMTPACDGVRCRREGLWACGLTSWARRQVEENWVTRWCLVVRRRGLLDGVRRNFGFQLDCLSRGWVLYPDNHVRNELGPNGRCLISRVLMQGGDWVRAAGHEG